MTVRNVAPIILSYLFIWSISQCVTIFHVAFTPSPAWKLWQFAQTTFLEGDLLTPLGLWHLESSRFPMWVPSSLSLGSSIRYNASLLWGYLLYPTWSLTLCTGPSFWVDILLLTLHELRHLTLGCHHSRWIPSSSQLGSITFSDLYSSPLLHPSTPNGRLPNSALVNGFKIEMFKKGRGRAVAHNFICYITHYV